MSAIQTVRLSSFECTVVVDYVIRDTVSHAYGSLESP
jgi:hypothetical protein